VALCEFKNSPIFGWPARNCFLKSAPFNTSWGIVSPRPGVFRPRFCV